MGVVGRTEKGAALTSMHEYQLLAEGWERRQRTQWETTRWHIFYDIMLNPNIKSANKPHRITDVVRFPWEPAEAEQKQESRPCTVTPEMNDLLNSIINGEDR